MMQTSSSFKYSLTVYAAGLDNPRGLKFGPDGFLYVAEGGSGGTKSTQGQCEQVPPPIGPYTGGSTGRISKLSQQGVRTTVVEDLPSTVSSPKSGGTISGVADIAFAGDALYALLAAGGCSHGNPELPNGIIRVHPNRAWGWLANLSEFLAAHPVANPDLEDLEPDGTWYSLLFVEGALYALDPHNGEVDRITLDGEISRLVDVSASLGHVVPTSICTFGGDFYLGNLTTFPLQQGAASIYKVTHRGELSVFKTGFTNITGVLFDPQGRLYVLESNVGVPRPARDTGQVIRVDTSGRIDTIAVGLSEPTAMTLGPDGSLYISNKGYGYPPGMGEIVRIEINPQANH